MNYEIYAEDDNGYCRFYAQTRSEAETLFNIVKASGLFTTIFAQHFTVDSDRYKEWHRGDDDEP